MEAHGWSFTSVTNPSMIHYRDICGTTPPTWYGYCSGSCVGSVSAVFQGSGTATLDFGNCHSGTVQVFLNGDEIDSATRYVKNKTITFPFFIGDKLRVQETHAIVKLNSLKIEC